MRETGTKAGAVGGDERQQQSSFLRWRERGSKQRERERERVVGDEVTDHHSHVK